MRNKMVSIIVPAYNAETTLARCLDSLVNQTYANIDIVLVDDGSTDGTAGQAKKYTQNSVRIFKRPHIGPNAARKVGVENSRGDYVMFVDADDYLRHDAVETVVNYFSKYDVDSIRFNGLREASQELVSPLVSAVGKCKLYNRDNAMRELLTTYRLNNLCLQAYKKELFLEPNIFETRIVYGEDLFANLHIYPNVKKMLAVGDVLYYYCENKNSTTRSIKIRRLTQNIIDRTRVSMAAINVSRREIIDKKTRKLVIRNQFRMIGSQIKSLYNAIGGRIKQ